MSKLKKSEEDYETLRILGINIERARIEAGLTQYELGKLCGLQNIYRIEVGMTGVSIFKFIKLCNCLNKTPTQLLKGTTLLSDNAENQFDEGSQ